MLKVWVIAFILLVCIVLQSALLPFLRIVGVQPDMLMILVVSVALLAGSSTGMTVGLAGGLILDILYGASVGYNAFVYMIIGYLAGLLNDKLYLGKIILPSVFVFLSVLFRGLLMSVYLFFNNLSIPLYQGFAVVVLPEAIYTLLLMPLFFYCMTRLFDLKFMKEKWHFKRP